MHYGLRLITGPSVEPISLNEVKAQLRIDGTADDTLLTSYIAAARAYVESTTGLALNTQTWEMTLHDWPFGTKPIVLPKQPVQSITSITYADTANATQTLASSVYEIDVTRTPGFISLTDGSDWPDVYDKQAAITIRFVAGYGATAASVPEPIRQAMLLLIGHWYANREQVTLGAGLTATQLPLGMDALLQPFKVYGF